MRKPVMSAIAALALAALLLQGCAAKSEFRTLKQIVSSRALQVFVNPAGEPFAYKSAGEARGSEVDFMRKFAESLGIEAMFTIATLEEIDQGLVTGAADVAIGKMLLAGESYPAGYSLPIAADRVYVVCRRGDLLSSFPALEGRKAGVLGGSELTGLVLPYLTEEAGPAQIQSANDAASFLNSSAIDAVICTLFDARRLMEEYGDDLYCEDIIGLEPLRYAAVTARGNDTLLAAINGFITESAMGDSSDDQGDKA